MSGNWRDFPLPDGSYSDDCKPFTQQDVVNYLPTFAEAQGTRSRVKYRTAPGLKHFANVEGPHRGGRDVEGKMFVVSGRNLYQIATDGTPTEIGVIPGTGFVSMTHNQIAGGNQLVIATGDNSYVYNTVTEVLTATGVPLVCVDFLNQRILGVDQARRFWRYSGVATATSWEELDNESAESSPDRIVGGIVSQGEWLVFGERTIEVFSNSPTEATAFQRTQVIEKGCASPHTICRLDNSVFFIGNDDVPYRLNGYTPTPIAPKAIIDAISQSSPRRLYAFTWEDRGYAVYYITAQDGQTFGYDVTSQRWHRRESYGLTRWRINTLFKSNGSWYAGDALNQRLYRLEWGYVYEGCEIMPRRFRTGVLHNDGNRVSVHGFRLTVATGGEPSVPSCPEPYVPPPDKLYGTIISDPGWLMSADGGTTFAYVPPPNTPGVFIGNTRFISQVGPLLWRGGSNSGNYNWRNSADGIAWSASIDINANGGVLWTGSAYVLWGAADTFLSETGAPGTWSAARPIGISGVLTCTNIGQTIVAVASSDLTALRVSTDAGASWVSATVSNGLGLLRTDGSQFVAFEYNDNAVQKSPTGLSGSWARTVISAGEAGDGVFSAYVGAAGRWLYVANNGKCFYSDDSGATWAEGALLPSDGDMSGPYNDAITRADGYFYVASVNSSDGSTNGIYRSPDGVQPWVLVHSEGVYTGTDLGRFSS